MKTFQYNGYGIPDNCFIRGSIPMTKAEVRAVTLSKMQLQKDDCMIDIGAGTGSVTVECAFNCKKVFVVERNPQAIELIEQNRIRFELENITVVAGAFPEVAGLPERVDVIFVGGSGGAIEEIFRWAERSLADEGRMVANFVTLENAVHFLNLMRTAGYRNVELVQVAVAVGQEIHGHTMMRANNPIFIIKGIKGGEDK